MNSSVKKKKVYPLWLGLAAAVNFIIEIMNRHSLAGACVFLFTKFPVFALGTLIILLTLCLSLFTRKRRFWMTVISSVWLLLGLTNGVILALRSTPFSAVDISLAVSCLPVLNMYLKIWQIAAIALLLVLLIAFAVVRFIKSAPQKPDFGFAVKCTLPTAALAAVLLGLTLYTGMVSADFPNLPDAYDAYGFTYCFSVSLFDKGIDRPRDYGKEEISDIGKEVETYQTDETASARPAGNVNVIVLQLESFIDPARLPGMENAKWAVPVFTNLKNTSSSGYLIVPSIGAGTANTEFEVLTGMSLDYFGAGEYPYKTVLLEKTCESMAYNLGKLGYVSTAIHNNNASFYGRDEVFANLGFDRFVPLECMKDVSYTSVGWAKDDVLTGVIMDALTSTEEPDFVFAISVQSHGKYPEDESAEEALPGCGYYVEQLREVDAFVGELKRKLEAYPEPVILALYGDHLPSFEYGEANLNDGSGLFQTEYVIWTNFDSVPEDKDLYTWQLGAEVLGRIGIHEGVITRLHQGRADDPEYEKYLEMLEYDMLYGKQIIWNGMNPYERRNITFGVHPLTVSNAEFTEEGLLVHGSGFTPFAAVLADGKTRETEYLDENTLLVRGLAPEEDGSIPEIDAVIADKHGKVLRRAEEE